MKYRSNLLWFLTMIVIVGISNASLLYDFEGGGPGFTVNGNATVDSGSMRLTENAGSLNGSVIFDQISTDPVADFEVSFDFLALNANGADGMSFALLDAGVFGSTAMFGESGPGVGSLSIGIDLYDNGGEAQAGGNYFDIRLDNVVKASAIPSITMEGTGWHHVEISFSSGLLTLVLTPEGGVAETIFDAVAVDGFTPFVALYGFGARTGGVSNEHRVDNVLFSTPEDVTNPSPRNGATDVPWDAILSWDTPEVALGVDDVYQVTLQTDGIADSNDVTIDYVTEPAYTPAELLLVETEYFWKIDIVDLSDTEPNVKTAGRWWSFTTKSIKPKITVNPSNVSTWPGDAVSFTCEATSDTPVTYLWYKGGVAISGETSNVLTITDAQDSDATDYYCVATNLNGSTQSASASLKIKHMLGWWKLDGDANAVEGLGSDGIINNAPADANDMFFEGMDGLAIGVNVDSEKDQYVDFGGVGITGEMPRTITCWAKNSVPWNQIDDWSNIFGFSSASGTSELSFDFNKRGGQDQYCIHRYGAEWNMHAIDGEWHFLIGTFENDTVTWYADGVYGGSATTNLQTQDIVRLGKRAHGDALWRGWVDDCRIYDFAMNATEAAELYTEIVLDAMICVGGNPAMDYSGDCRVGIEDLALFISEWLECNLVPECKP